MHIPTYILAPFLSDESCQPLFFYLGKMCFRAKWDFWLQYIKWPTVWKKNKTTTSKKHCFNFINFIAWCFFCLNVNLAKFSSCFNCFIYASRAACCFQAVGSVHSHRLMSSHCSNPTVGNHLTKRRHSPQVFLPLEECQCSLFVVLFLRDSTSLCPDSRVELQWAPAVFLAPLPRHTVTFSDGDGRHHIKCALSGGCGGKLWDNSFSANTCATQGAHWPVALHSVSVKSSRICSGKIIFYIKLCERNRLVLCEPERFQL